MADWLVEHGFGETRAALVEGDEIVEARIELAGIWRAGSMVDACLISTGTSGRNAIARDRNGVEILLPRGAPGVTEGARVKVWIRRAAIPGTEPWKRPLARLADHHGEVVPRLADRLDTTELPLPRPHDELAENGWNDLLEEARTGTVEFVGGTLSIVATPAMTLIDVDGYLPPEELAVRGAAQAARAIRRLDIGGSIGIDLPTTQSGKAARQSAAEALDAHLPQPFERTAVNGFGFIQVVRPRRRASLIELALDRPAFEARALLRRAAFEPPGPKCLVANPAVIAVLDLHPAWLDHLARSLGGGIGLRTEAALPISGGYAEIA